ncbi:ankyrin repeat-containing domain protein [Mycena rebaudengoi]|nr:ankyrin repeat-containing domain protein [Mycena rebaudengoi]
MWSVVSVPDSYRPWSVSRCDYNLTLELEIRTELRNISQNQQNLQDCKPVSTVRREWDVDKGTAVEREKIIREHEKIVKERKEIFDWDWAVVFFVKESFRTGYHREGLFGVVESLELGRRSIVVDYLRTELQGNSTGVAAVYLNHKESEAQSPSNILAGLWWQLMSKRPISTVVQQLYKKHQDQHTRPSLDEVRNILTATTAEYSKLFFVVDALDEYPEANRNILLKALAAMGKSVSLMLTSQPNITPEAFFSTALVLEISAKDEDIRSYVRAQIQSGFRLSKHVRARPELHEEIETKIAENTDGMFLIAKLHIDSLATKSTVKAVRDALQNLPEDLEHTYDEAMDRIEAQNKDDREIAQRTLIWVANAKRPLTVSKLQEALAINPDSKMLDVDGLLDIEIILSVCVGLVIIDATQSRSLFLDKAQTEITRTCLTYISYTDIPKSLHYAEQGLLSYASYYCLLHAVGEPELLLRDHIIQFLGDAHQWQHLCRFSISMVPLQWYHTKWPPVPSKLWVAALFGLQEIARYLLENDNSISEEEKAGSLNVALHWKCLGVIRALIKHGTNRNPLQAFVGNSLQLAAKEGRMGLVQLLLEHSTDPNLQGGKYGTASQAALVEGHTEVLQLLLEHGADVSVQGGRYGDLLQVASAKGHLEMVQLLLKNGADVNAQGGCDGAALQAASAGRKSITMLDLMYNLGVRVATQGRGSHREIVQLLLENGADVNLWGGYYETTLQAASQYGRMEIVQSLLVYGADVNAQGGKYGTALQAASVEGHMEVVQLLLENGADVNTQGGRYGTALQATLLKGHVKVVQLLLEHGADANLRRAYYGNALQSASHRGKKEVVRLLLDHGADVNVRGGNDGTALYAASEQGHLEIIRLLLEHGANVNAREGDNGTALHAASAEGHLEIVQLLLEHGADVNVRGGRYGTAYRAAMAWGHTHVAPLLVAHGADRYLDLDVELNTDQTDGVSASIWHRFASIFRRARTNKDADSSDEDGSETGSNQNGDESSHHQENHSRDAAMACMQQYAALYQDKSG